MGQRWVDGWRIGVAVVVWTSAVPALEPSDTAPSDTAPTDTAPSDTAPSDTAPTDTAPSVQPRGVIPRAAGEHAEGFAQRALGARAAIDLSNAGERLPSGALYERGIALLGGPVVSARYFDELWIGGGAEGVTYSLFVDVAVGARWLVGQWHGPFARAGLVGHLRRSGGLYHSTLRIPALQLGWGGFHGNWLLDGYASIAPAVLGKIGPPDGRESVTGLFAGAGLTVGWDRIRLDVEAGRLLTGGSLLETRNFLCAFWGKKAPKQWYGTKRKGTTVNEGTFAVDYSASTCLDAKLVHSTVDELSRNDFRNWSLGFSLVVGQFSRLDPRQ